MSAAAEAKAAGYGGIAAASRVTKLARSTIGRGLKDLRDPGSLGRKVRRKGGGSPRLATKDPTLLADLERLLEPATMGDPMRPLRWVSKSHDKLATCALSRDGSQSQPLEHSRAAWGISIVATPTAKTIRKAANIPIATLNSNLAARAKVEAFRPVEPDRISTVISRASRRTSTNCSAMSFKNGGSDESPQGRPIGMVNTHDFERQGTGSKVVRSSGVWTTSHGHPANDGSVSLGIDHDTGQFAVNTVRLWLEVGSAARVIPG